MRGHVVENTLDRLYSTLGWRGGGHVVEGTLDQLYSTLGWMRGGHVVESTLDQLYFILVTDNAQYQILTRRTKYMICGCRKRATVLGSSNKVLPFVSELAPISLSSQ